MLLVFLHYLANLSWLFNINNDGKTRFMNVSSRIQVSSEAAFTCFPVWEGWLRLIGFIWGAWAWSSKLWTGPFNHSPLPKWGGFNSEAEAASAFASWAEVLPHCTFPFHVCPKGPKFLTCYLPLFSGPYIHTGSPQAGYLLQERDFWGFSQGLKAAPVSSSAQTREKGIPASLRFSKGSSLVNPLVPTRAYSKSENSLNMSISPPVLGCVSFPLILFSVNTTPPCLFYLLGFFRISCIWWKFLLFFSVCSWICSVKISGVFFPDISDISGVVAGGRCLCLVCYLDVLPWRDPYTVIYMWPIGCPSQIKQNTAVWWLIVK